ncbi:hypothetical protein D3C73_1511660 [compost metagenome]
MLTGFGLLFQIEQHHVIAHGLEFHLTASRNLYAHYLLHLHRTTRMYMLVQLCSASDTSSCRKQAISFATLIFENEIRSSCWCHRREFT